MANEMTYGPPEFSGECHDLTCDLSECANLLREHGEEHWSAQLEQALSYYSPITPDSGVCRLLSWFGGMGSFHDIYLCKVNGNRFDPDEDEELVNQNLRDLQTRIYNSLSAMARANR